MSMIRWVFYRCVIFLVLPSSAFAENVPSLSVDDRALAGLSLGKFVEFVEDVRTVDRLAEVREQWTSLDRRSEAQGAFSLGLMAKAHWFKMRLTQPAAAWAWTLLNALWKRSEAESESCYGTRMMKPDAIMSSRSS